MGASTSVPGFVGLAFPPETLAEEVLRTAHEAGRPRKVRSQGLRNQVSARFAGLEESTPGASLEAFAGHA